MALRRIFAVVFFWLSPVIPASAGLYYSGEVFNPLPTQWRGFLLDQRTLRNIAIPPKPGTPANATRSRYEQAAAALEKARQQRKLNADESADLGAIYVRLGENGKALELLRNAQREHPNHFHIAANLGTAWQLQGDLDQAAAALEQAVRLAPGVAQKAEEYQLKLVRHRRHQAKGNQSLDDLFGVRYVGESGKYEPGKWAAAERQKLPAEALAVTQQLALWLPADPRLLWQLAELAAAHGDVRTAAAIMDGCVEFGLRTEELLEHRRLLRAAAEVSKPKPGDRAAHEEHVSAFKARSTRPLASKLDTTVLPPIDPKGVNAIPWSVVTETTIDRHYRPTFPKYLRELDGKTICLSGYMQPLGDDPECAAFLFIENPIGCWYCEMPDLTGIVLVDLPAGKTKMYTRGRIQVTGELKLNSRDPENFLYTLEGATVKDLE
jgi:Flp pilus assembly protein TadD